MKQNKVNIAECCTVFVEKTIYRAEGVIPVSQQTQVKPLALRECKLSEQLLYYFIIYS